MKLTKAQLRALRWARRDFDDGRVPPYVFNNHRSIRKLLATEIIEYWHDYGAPMYKFTKAGLDALDAAD